MAPERPRLILTKLALTYATGGAALGALLATAYVFSAYGLSGEGFDFRHGIWREALSVLWWGWLFALVPAALVAFVLCVAIRNVPAVYTDQRRRVMLAAALSAFACLIWCALLYGPLQHGFLQFSGFICTIGVVSGAVMAYLLPRSQRVPSNPSLERP